MLKLEEKTGNYQNAINLESRTSGLKTRRTDDVDGHADH